MSNPVERPKRGLPPDEALAKWSDPELYAELVRLSGRNPPANFYAIDHAIRGEAGRKAYSQKREVVEAAFIEKLLEGKLFASAVEAGARSREIIEPSLWDVISIDYLLGAIVGEHYEFQKPEFFDRSIIPANVKWPPDWLQAEIATTSAVQNEFRHDTSYRHLSFNGCEFTFGEIQAEVVRLLHQAAQTDDPWRKGAAILDEAGSSQIKIVDVFKSQKNWKRLIESDDRGFYRLRIDKNGKPLPA